MESSKAFWHEVLNIKLDLFKKNVKRNLTSIDWVGDEAWNLLKLIEMNLKEDCLAHFQCVPLLF